MALSLTSSLSSELKATSMGGFQPLDRPSNNSTAMINLPTRRGGSAVKPIRAAAARSDSVGLLSATTFAAPKTEERVKEEKETKLVEEDYEKLAKELENGSPLEIMDKALATFGNDIAIAFSGAEDVALIEYAKLTGRPLRVLSLDLSSDYECTCKLVALPRVCLDWACFAWSARERRSVVVVVVGRR